MRVFADAGLLRAYGTQGFEFAQCGPQCGEKIFNLLGGVADTQANPHRTTRQFWRHRHGLQNARNIGVGARAGGTAGHRKTGPIELADQGFAIDTSKAK